jgi:hypothetical protein
MRVGVTIFCQNYGDLNRNYGDWERYEVEEEGEAASKRAVPSDYEIVSEEVDIARRVYSERLSNQICASKLRDVRRPQMKLKHTTQCCVDAA